MLFHVVVVGVFLALAGLTAGWRIEGAPLCEAIKEYKNCTTRRDCSWCSNAPEKPDPQLGGSCFDPKKTSCCIAHKTDCMEPLLCTNATQYCCLPNYGCEYAGKPTCCQRGDVCCGGRHNAGCCNAMTSKCCWSPGYSTCCPKDSTCCSGLSPSNGIWTAYCCASGTKCAANGGGCV